MKTIFEPFKIKSVEKLKFTTIEERVEILKKQIILYIFLFEIVSLHIILRYINLNGGIYETYPIFTNCFSFYLLHAFICPMANMQRSLRRFSQCSYKQWFSSVCWNLLGGFLPISR